MTAQPNTLHAGAAYRCATCGATQVATGRENSMWCHGGSRHPITRMDLVVDCDSDDTGEERRG